MEKLRKMNEQAVQTTTRALSKLIGKQVKITASEIAERDMGAVPTILNPEGMTAGVYLPVGGDIGGSSLLAVSGQTAFLLCDILLGRKLGTTRTIDAMEEASLKEMGNIVCGSYVSALSNVLQVEMIEGLPEFSYGMASAMMEQVVVHFARCPQKFLLIELCLEIEGVLAKPIVGYVIFIFSTEAEAAMMEALGSEERGA